MKGLFYFPVNVDIYPDSSIVKKNSHIISSVRRLGIEADVITFSSRGINFNSELIKPVDNYKIVRGLSNYIFAFGALKKLDFRKYDFAWVRSGLCLPPYLSFIRQMKKQNPNLKIVLEYGSFPFKEEIFGYQKMLFPASEILSKRLKNYVSNVITYCGQDEIYGIPTIKIGNGIDTTQIQWSDTPRGMKNVFHLIAVSSLLYWHGYDRIIAGLKNYYQNPERGIDVVFHIVGDGMEKINLERQAAAAKLLGDKVIFHGFKTGQDLDEIFSQSHIALGSMGAHRKYLTADSALKNREYVARGFPFALAMSDADFSADLPFVKYLPADESPIDIAALIEFYKTVAEKYPNYSGLIRKYAEENLTWETKIKQVLETINKPE